jgi:hypothetical protein
MLKVKGGKAGKEILERKGEDGKAFVRIYPFALGGVHHRTGEGEESMTPGVLPQPPGSEEARLAFWVASGNSSSPENSLRFYFDCFRIKSKR